MATPEPSNSSWQHAVTRHLSRLSPEQAAQIRGSTNIRELLDAVVKELGEGDWREYIISDREYHKNKRYRVWRVIDRSLRPLKRFGAVIDTVTQVNSLIGCSIWAPLKLVTQICCDHVDLLDYLDHTLSTICENVDRINHYEDIFGRNDMVQGALGFLYADYLDFCTRLIQYNKKRAVSKIFVSFEDDFQSVCATMKEHEQRFDFTAIAAYISEDTLARRQEVKDRKQALFREILHWIGGPSDFDEDLRKLRACRQDKSCDWFVNGNRFHNWSRSRYHLDALLWVHGNPGCGKSVLASSVVDYFKKVEDVTKKPVFYFFCKNDSVNKNSSLAILRSLMAQVLLWAPGLSAHVEESFHRNGKKQIDSFYSLLPVFLTCLANARDEFVAIGGDDSNDDSNGYIVIDGVDECDESALTDICSAIKLWFKARPSTMFSLLFTSRYSQKISDALGQVLYEAEYKVKRRSYEMSSSDTKDHIPSFVKAGVARSPSLKAAEASGVDVCSTIVDAANGHWLYARLALEDAMRQPTLGLLKQSIYNMPNNLSKLYSKILIESQRHMNENEIRIANIIFEWVYIARMPRPLGVSDVSTILSLREGQTCLNLDDAPLDCAGLIRRLCTPLLEVDESQKVIVTHQSVKEYFLQASRDKDVGDDDSLPSIISSIHKTALSLACTSVAFILLKDFQSSPSKSSSYEQIDAEFPLLQHVILPIWDWFGKYAFQAGQAYLGDSVNLEPCTASINRLAQFLTSPQNLPWITTTLHTYGQHDLSVLFTRVALCVALSRDIDAPEEKASVWTALFPGSFEAWITDFHALAKHLNWRFRFYEVVRSGNLSSDGDNNSPETGGSHQLGPYSLEILPVLEKWSFPEYASYDDNGIHFCGHQVNDHKVSAIIDKALESLMSDEDTAGPEGSLQTGEESASESGADEAGESAHGLLPSFKESRSFVQARKLFFDGEWDLWWFSYKTGNVYQRLGRNRGYP